MPKIVVIEDEPAIRENIIEVLELDGFEAVGAGGGLEGINAAQQHLPDLIICDIMMPDLDGFGVLEELRSNEDTRDIPFIFVSAKAERHSIRHGMEIGADDYLTKPFTPDELLSAVNARLHRHGELSASASKNLEAFKQQLLQMVSHELRKPLLSINTVLDIISRQSSALEPLELQELLDSVQMGSKHLNRVVEQIMHITHAETGKLSEIINTQGTSWQLWEVLITATDLARQFTPNRTDVQVKMTERDQSALIKCEPKALKHAIAELISNALAFSPSNSYIEITQWVAEGGAWLSIVDRGPGIPETKIKEALTDFGRIHSEMGEQKGVGLGLPVARRVIEAHHGILEIKSVVGKGTQALVGLPLGQ